MKLADRTRRAAQGPGSRAERRRAAKHHPDPRQRAAGGRRGSTGLLGHRPRHGNRRLCAGPGGKSRPDHRTKPTRLYEIVRKLPEGAEVSLGFSGADPRLAVVAGRYKVHLPVLPSGDFPVMPTEGLSTPITIDTGELIRLIDKTRFAISTEETRYYPDRHLPALGDPGRPRSAARLAGHRRPPRWPWPRCRPRKTPSWRGQRHRAT